MVYMQVVIFAGTFMLGDERELYRYCASEGIEARVGKLNVTTPALGKLVPMPEVPLGECAHTQQLVETLLNSLRRSTLREDHRWGRGRAREPEAHKSARS
eukprot:6210010-Pleurochrysis_carterae.AAC.2